LQHDSKPKPVLSSGVLSDVTHTGTNNTALKNFMKQSKVLRFREKMENVKLWRNNSIAFAAEHKSIVENPNSDLGQVISEIDVKLIDQIEEEFEEHEKKMEQRAREKAMDKDSDYNKKKRQRFEMDLKDKKDEKDEMATSNDLGEVPVSLPHSKSLSNNRSRSSMHGEL
jgi:hypothetical protein